MLIERIESQPFHAVRALAVQQGTRAIHEHVIPFFRAWCNSLPPGLEAIAFTSDLQARTDPTAQEFDLRLAGETVAEELAILAEMGEIPPADRVGAVILGDMFARPGLDRRGGSGDVRLVWEAFRTRFRWVAGVAGNHDLFGSSPREFHEFTRLPNLHFLDGNCAKIDRLLFGGVSGVVGERARPFRRSRDRFLADVKQVLSVKPDVLLLHMGPPKDEIEGIAELRPLLNEHLCPLTAFGHNHWPLALEHLPGGGQLLNVEGRVVVLQRTGKSGCPSNG